MLVPSAKHLDLHAAPPQSRLVLFQIKPPLLSISTPTPSPAWSFVSLSSKMPPVELPPPKKKLPYVGHLPTRRLLPGQAVRRLSAAAAQGALCSRYKSCPWEALPTDTKRGFIKDDPARAAAAPGWWGDKPSAAAHRQSWQPGVSAGCEMDGTSIRTRAFFLDHVAIALGEQLFFLTSLFCSLKNLRGKNSLASKQGVTRSRRRLTQSWALLHRKAITHPEDWTVANTMVLMYF